MSGFRQKKRKRPELNLVPLIDVLVMLIFFAFVTMQFRSATMLTSRSQDRDRGQERVQGLRHHRHRRQGPGLLQRQGRDRRRAPRRS
jgi:hypothetical protein